MGYKYLKQPRAKPQLKVNKAQKCNMKLWLLLLAVTGVVPHPPSTDAKNQNVNKSNIIIVVESRISYSFIDTNEIITGRPTDIYTENGDRMQSNGQRIVHIKQ